MQKFKTFYEDPCWDTHKQVGTKISSRTGKRVPNCVPKNENQKAALMKKLAKTAQSSEKGKKAVTLAKAPFKIPGKGKDEGYVSHAQRKAVWANKADGGKGHPDKKRKK